MRGRSTVALVAACAALGAQTAAAAPPQGIQSDAAFAASYAQHAVTSVAATAQHVSCYAPEVYYQGSLVPSQGFPDGGSTLCNGTATTGELIGPYPSQDVANPPLKAKDFSESDLHVDPTNARHLIGVSKWIVNAEGYNHLAGFFESFDGGATWPQAGHVPGYEGWTDNSDPVGAFDPWGNFYAVVFPYMFSYSPTGQHVFLSPTVNPSLPRSVLAVAVRSHGAATPVAWSTTRGNGLDVIAHTPFRGSEVFDKQWITIDTNRRSRHFGRVYVSWAIGNDDTGLRIYLSHADAKANGTHTNWSAPRLVMAETRGTGDNGSLPRAAPDGTVWLATSSFSSPTEPFVMKLVSSKNGGNTWSKSRLIVRHQVNGYRNTTFRAAFGEAFAVGPRKVGKFYPLYAAYERSVFSGSTVFLRGSFDGGRHWTRAVQVNDSSGGDALQPNLAVAPSGTVAVAFYDRRLACPARDTAEATIAGLLFDPRTPNGAVNYCINTAIQFYRARLRPVGHNIRLSEHTWDPQLSSPRFDCICNAAAGFIGDYFGVDSRGGFTYTASVETYNAAGENPGYHQQQLVAKLRTP